MWIEKHGQVYRIRDLVAGKKITVETGYRTKTAAKTAMTTKAADKLRGDQLMHRGGRITLSEWIATWWVTYAPTLKPSSRVSAEGIIRRYIEPMLGSHELDEVGAPVVQRWISDLLAGRTAVAQPRPLAEKTVRNAHGLLHKIMSSAVLARRIRANPCADTGLPATVHHEMRFLTQPEAERLVAAIPPYWQTLVLLLLATGLRWGEAIGLRVRDVDVLTQRLTVRTTTQELADTAEIVDVAPKTAASRRTVTFTPEVAAVLIPLVAGRDRDARVFTAPMGGAVRIRRFYVVWIRARQQAGLNGLRIHDLRHTHAAWLISDGVPPTAVQRRLGHASITVTSDRYGHLMPEVDDRILATVRAALAGITLGGVVGESGYVPVPLQPTQSRSSAGHEMS